MQAVSQRHRIADILDLRFPVRHKEQAKTPAITKELVEAKVKKIVRMYVPDASGINMEWTVLETIDLEKLGFLTLQVYSRGQGRVQDGVLLEEIKRDIQDVGHEAFIDLYGPSVRFRF